MTLYAVERLGVRIGGRSVADDVSFSVEAGRCTALVGASGSGKSMSCLTPFGLSKGRCQRVGAPRRARAGRDAGGRTSPLVRARRIRFPEPALGADPASHYRAAACRGSDADRRPTPRRACA